MSALDGSVRVVTEQVRARSTWLVAPRQVGSVLVIARPAGLRESWTRGVVWHRLSRRVMSARVTARQVTETWRVPARPGATSRSSLGHRMSRPRKVNWACHRESRPAGSEPVKSRLALSRQGLDYLASSGEPCLVESSQCMSGPRKSSLGNKSCQVPAQQRLSAPVTSRQVFARHVKDP